jgi:hypothetical protein
MNWEVIIINVVTALPATIFACAAFVQAYKTHKSVNSRMDELLETAKIIAAMKAEETIRLYKEGAKSYKES